MVSVKILDPKKPMIDVFPIRQRVFLYAELVRSRQNRQATALPVAITDRCPNPNNVIGGTQLEIP